jgi:hypothetical protein
MKSNGTARCYIKDFESAAYILTEVGRRKTSLAFSLSPRREIAGNQGSGFPAARLTFVGLPPGLSKGGRFVLRISGAPETAKLRICRDGSTEWEYRDFDVQSESARLQTGFFEKNHEGFRLEILHSEKPDPHKYDSVVLELDFEPAEATALDGHCQLGNRRPRLLVIDSTPIGQESATGQLKKTFLGDWPESDVLQIWESTQGGKHAFHELRLGQAIQESHADRFDIDTVVDRCVKFGPDAIYFRPVDSELLHSAFLRVHDNLQSPVVLQVMDDWPERLRRVAPSRFSALDSQLRASIARADVLLSICDEMSNAYARRYGGAWFPLANGIDVDRFPVKNWPGRPPVTKENPFILRYMGGIAEDMNFSSVGEVAAAVSELQETVPIRFEIYTMSWYMKSAREHFGSLGGVSVHPLVDERNYPALLAGSDALLIAYNFDELSVAYTRYSLANKLPECLGSGAAVLAYGPLQIATIRHLSDLGCSHVVTKRDSFALQEALRFLATRIEDTKQLGMLGSSLARTEMNKELVERQFRSHIENAVTRRGARSAISTGGVHQYTGAAPVIVGQTEWRRLDCTSLQNEFEETWIVSIPAAGILRNSELGMLLLMGGTGSALCRVTASTNGDSKPVTFDSSGRFARLKVVQSPSAGISLDIRLTVRRSRDGAFDPKLLIAYDAGEYQSRYSFRETNTLFRRGSHLEALAGYLHLFHRRPLDLYAKSAVFCASKLNGPGADASCVHLCFGNVAAAAQLPGAPSSHFSSQSQ